MKRTIDFEDGDIRKKLIENYVQGDETYKLNFFVTDKEEYNPRISARLEIYEDE